jgi:hypothetical protein
MAWSQGDSNYDGMLDFTDLLAMAQNYGAAPAVFEADWLLARSLVPEPFLAAGLIPILGLARRRRA